MFLFQSNRSLREKGKAENGGVVESSLTMDFCDVAKPKAQMILPRILFTIALSTLQDILHLRLMGWSG